eukprot:CAMPEP_0206461844 /NCGR_PEP_ID=MMETSP0324_2-20121206/25611_1 /ASSEMBLY_ACC=CAM_ASM_000836 /TAXON_ID=2866 /ORGANISM="Crypthecodinium cohnii, Strain Seligo" /LENGTH=814 /DNA_ID=CAMNT_0053933859 /DNA_START=213 /DNA_END=2658 /DNA_ORIENTATION=-
MHPRGFEALTRWTEEIKDFTLLSRDSLPVAHLLVGPDGHIDGSHSPVMLKFRIKNMTIQRQFFAVPSPVHGAQISIWDGTGWKKEGIASGFILQTRDRDSVLTAEGGFLTGLIRRDGLLLDLRFSLETDEEERVKKSKRQTRGGGGRGSSDSRVRLQVTAKDASGILPKEARATQIPHHIAQKLKTTKRNSESDIHTERRLDLSPDEIDQWTNCYTGETVTKMLEMGVVLGPKLYLEWSSTSVAEAYVASMVVKTNMVYVPQFNVALDISKLNIVKSYTGAPSYTEDAACSQTLDSDKADTTQLDAFSTASLDELALWHLLEIASTPPLGGVTGLAWVGGICDWTNEINRGVTWHNTETWITFAHEVGHNFGAGHTFGKGGIMDYEDGMLDGIYQFYSDGNEAEMCKEMASVIGSCSYITDATSTCGNSVLEPTEECECAAGSKSCSYCSDCVLQDCAQCSPDSVSDSVCCNSDGTFAGPSTTCTDWEGEVGYCSDGICYSIATCTYYDLGDYVGPTTSNSCRFRCSGYPSDVISSSTGGALNDFPDGTVCGATSAGTCTSGACSESESASSQEQDKTETISSTNVSDVIQAAAGTAAETVEGCTGYSKLMFSGSPDIRLAKRAGGFSFEDCQYACQQSAQCGAFSHSNSTQECHLWSATHLTEKLSGSSKFDTFMCPGWAIAPDCESWPGMVPGRHGYADAKRVPCTSCESGNMTLAQCDKMCQDTPECHVFAYGKRDGVEGYCGMWDSSTTLADLMPPGKGIAPAGVREKSAIVGRAATQRWRSAVGATGAWTPRSVLRAAIATAAPAIPNR